MFNLNFLKTLVLLVPLISTAFAGAGGPTASEDTEGGAPRLISSMGLSSPTPPQPQGSKADTSLDAPESMQSAPLQHIPVPVTDTELQVAVTKADRLARQMYNEGTPFGALPPELLAHIARQLNSLQDILRFTWICQKTNTAIQYDSHEWLSLNCMPINDGVLHLCTRFTGLTHLDFENIDPNLRFFVPLSEIKHLLEAIFKSQADASLSRIQTLSLRGRNRGFDSEPFTCIVETLRKLSHIRKLDLSEIELYSDETRSVFPVFHSMFQLRHLNLSDNDIGEGAEALAIALQHTPLLQVLNLRRAQLNSDGATALAKALPYLTQLQVLDLSNNIIKLDGVRELSRVLPSLTQLQVLDLSDNIIEPDDVKELSRVLPSLTQLRHLNLSGSEIGPKGAIDLAGAFPYLTQLQVLDLSDNDLDKATCQTVRNTLQHLSDLTIYF